MFLNLILLVVGFVLLIKGADVFVEGASKVAAMLHIPQIVIGLTIVAFGTSAPEAAVSIASAFKGTAGIAIGNIIGSNIANVLLILGLSGMIGALVVKKNTFFIESPFVVFITIILLLLGYLDGNISFVDGCILWVLFIMFLCYLHYLTKQGDDSAIDDIPELDENDKLWKLIVMIVLGIVCVVVGSDITVDAASFIAKSFGVSDRIIGLTIVSIGTSLPELVTSVSASFKGRNDIAIGNIIGSNIFNILFVLGTAALVAPVGIPFAANFLMDGMIAVGAILMFMVFSFKGLTLKKYGSFVMLISYICYLIYIL